MHEISKNKLNNNQKIYVKDIILVCLISLSAKCCDKQALFRFDLKFKTCRKLYKATVLAKYVGL